MAAGASRTKCRGGGGGEGKTKAKLGEVEEAVHKQVFEMSSNHTGLEECDERQSQMTDKVGASSSESDCDWLMSEQASGNASRKCF